MPLTLKHVPFEVMIYSFALPLPSEIRKHTHPEDLHVHSSDCCLQIYKAEITLHIKNTNGSC